MSRLTFYRKYRSNTFDEIIGQEHIIQTLTNALEHNRLTHAYIFSGPRGTGKTSCARILAKAINCRNGKSATPCLECDLCQKITRGTSVDVIEIDAASNTGVDNIRSLNEQVNFTPVECLYKIYIIDEVHMLSSGAFNALLKTLEEPPANIMFILATTEPQKIPATIHSRCQRLQFRRLTSQDIMKQLRIIAQNEGLKIEENSLQIIAQNANGGMRDAISLLDQIYSFKGNEINYEDVLLILGTTNRDSLVELISDFLDNNAEQMLNKLQKIIDDGINVQQLVGDLAEIFEHLVLVKLNVAKQLDVSAAYIEKLTQLANKLDLPRLQELTEQFARLELELKSFPNPELFLRVKFLTLIQIEPSAKPAATQTIQAQPTPQIKPQPAPQVIPEIKIPNQQLTNNAPPTPPSTPAPTPVPAPIASVDMNNLDEIWNKILEQLKENRILYNMLVYAKITQIKDGRLCLRLKETSFTDFVTKQKEFLEGKIKLVLNKHLQLEVESGNKTTQENAGAQTDNAAAAQQEKEMIRTRKINEIIEIFEGTVL